MRLDAVARYHYLTICFKIHLKIIDRTDGPYAASPGRYPTIRKTTPASHRCVLLGCAVRSYQQDPPIGRGSMDMTGYGERLRLS